MASRVPCGSITELLVDLQSTNVVGNMAKVLIWCDDEYGLSSRMPDVADYITDHWGRDRLTTPVVVGGGDTSRAIGMYGLDEADFDHVSIAGGAYIRALTGAGLVGVEVLARAAERRAG